MSRKTPFAFLASLFSFLPIIATASTEVPASSSAIHYTGRVLVEGDSATLGYPGIEVIVNFKGSSIGVSGEVLGGNSHYNVSIDGEQLPRLDLTSGAFSLSIATGLVGEGTHTLRLVRRSESWVGQTRFDSFSLSSNGNIHPADNNSNHRILCIGDSITCGEKTDLDIGYVEVDSTAWNAERSYGWFLAKDFDSDVNIVSYGGKGLIRDWQGKTTEVTAPQFFERTLPDAQDKSWNHSSYSPDLVTICLGTNDFSQGIVERDVFVPAYVAFVKRIHEVHPEAKVLLVASPWFGAGDDEEKKAALNGYILETIETVNKDGEAYANHHFFDATYRGTTRDLHPTGRQHRAMADHIGETLREWLSW